MRGHVRIKLIKIEEKKVIVQSGWMINSDGSLRLVTPFAGFVK